MTYRDRVIYDDFQPAPPGWEAEYIDTETMPPHHYKLPVAGWFVERDETGRVAYVSAGVVRHHRVVNVRDDDTPDSLQWIVGPGEEPIDITTKDAAS